MSEYTDLLHKFGCSDITPGQLKRLEELEAQEAKPKPPEPIHILSLGAGVQSSTLALMAAAGEVTPMPKAAIFADTQAEPKSVYTWLDWLEKQLPFPVHRVTAGNLMDDSVKIRKSKLSGRIYMRGAIPAFVSKPDGSRGILGRQCTADYKIRPLTQKARTLCDWKRGERRPLVKLWIGISYDEVMRMKPSREAWIEHQWPLIDKRMTRQKCIAWMKDRGFDEPPRSACIFCPFHSDNEWRRIKQNDPDGWNLSVAYEKRLQSGAMSQEVLTGVPFLHESCVPLDEVDLDQNKAGYQQLHLFNNECTGLCGV